MTQRNAPCYTPRPVTLRAEETAASEEAKPDSLPNVLGYAAVFYDGSAGSEYELWDGFIERIAPGAFDRALAEDDVRCFFNHDMNWVLGRNRSDPPTLQLSVDAVGLRYEVIPPNTQAGRDVVELVRRRDVTGSSFWFRVRGESFEVKDDVTIATITDVKLYEGGPVVFPAYEKTSAELAKRYIEQRRQAFDRFRSTLRPADATAADTVRRANYSRLARARSLD